MKLTNQWRSRQHGLLVGGETKVAGSGRKCHAEAEDVHIHGEDEQATDGEEAEGVAPETWWRICYEC